MLKSNIYGQNWPIILVTFYHQSLIYWRLLLYPCIAVVHIISTECTARCNAAVQCKCISFFQFLTILDAVIRLYDLSDKSINFFSWKMVNRTFKKSENPNYYWGNFQFQVNQIRLMHNKVQLIVFYFVIWGLLLINLKCQLKPYFVLRLWEYSK